MRPNCRMLSARTVLGPVRLGLFRRWARLVVLATLLAAVPLRPWEKLSVDGAADDAGLRLCGQLNGWSKTLPFTFPTKKVVTSDASTETPRMTAISVNIEAPPVIVGSFS